MRLSCYYHVNYTINQDSLWPLRVEVRRMQNPFQEDWHVCVYICMYSMRERGRGGGKQVNQQTGTHHDACGHSTTAHWFKSRHIYHTAYIHTYKHKYESHNTYTTNTAQYMHTLEYMYICTHILSICSIHTTVPFIVMCLIYKYK